MLAPHRVDEALGGDDVTSVDHEYGEHCALAPPTHIQNLPVEADDEVAEEADNEAPIRLHVRPRVVLPDIVLPTVV
jgi:hypothetical protein